MKKGAACVMMCNRKSSRADNAQEAISKIASEAGGRTKVVTVTCDLQSFASVRQAAAEVNNIAANYDGLDGLLNNAVSNFITIFLSLFRYNFYGFVTSLGYYGFYFQMH